MIRFLFLIIIYSMMLEGKILNINELIIKALSNNPDIKTLNEQIKISNIESNILSTISSPKINLNLEYSPTKTFLLQQNNNLTTIQSDSLHTDLTLNYLLFDFEQNKYKIEISNNSEQINEVLLQENKKLLAYKILKTYDLMVLEDKNMKIEEQNLKFKKILLSQADAFYKKGLKTKADRERINSAYMDAINAKEIASSRYQKAKISMQYLIGEKLENKFYLEDTLSSDKVKKFNNEKLNLYKNKLSNNSSLKIAQLLVDSGDKNINLQKSKAKPSINLFATYGYDTNMQHYETHSIGIKSSIPIFDGNTNELEVQKAFIEKSKILSEHESKKSNLEENLMTLMIDANRYLTTIEAKKYAIESAKIAKNISYARYKEGLSTYIEVLEASEVQNNSTKALFLALYERNNILHMIDYLTREDI